MHVVIRCLAIIVGLSSGVVLLNSRPGGTAGMIGVVVAACLFAASVILMRCPAYSS